VDDVGRVLDPPVRWVRARWDEPDLVGQAVDGLDGSCMTFLYEFTAAGVVLRAIELLGASDHPVGAASLAEFWQAQEYRRQAATPSLLVYESRYGNVPQGVEADWGDYPHEAITEEEFERVWTTSRAHLDEDPRDSHFRTPGM